MSDDRTGEAGKEAENSVDPVALLSLCHRCIPWHRCCGLVCWYYTYRTPRGRDSSPSRQIHGVRFRTHIATSVYAVLWT